jgi:hypothetical protein
MRPYKVFYVGAALMWVWWMAGLAYAQSKSAPPKITVYESPT